MIQLTQGGAYLVNGTDIVADTPEAASQIQAKTGITISREEAAKNTMAYGILREHNTSGNMDKLKIRFDKLTSHDITFVGIIQTARASGLQKFPMPYVLTNCHNSLCAVGGTINEDDHMFGLTCAKKYGGVYVPPHQAVIHQFAREMLAGGGKMILGSDSHTRYGALGTMAMGEGGPELVKQLLNQTYDINMPGVVAVYLKGAPVKGVGPQDVALAIIGAVFKNGYVKNKVMEFVGPGVASLSADFRIGIDVMTTETTCLTSIWRTDEDTRNYLAKHHREADYKKLDPADVAYYDGCVYVDLSTVKPMIALPFHPSNAFEIDELKANMKDILHMVEMDAEKVSGGKAHFTLLDKIAGNDLMVQQGIIAGCAGGNYSNVIEAAHALGMTYPQTLRRIILPEAFEVALPTLGNSFISIIKGTSLAFTCAVVEITAQGQIIGGRTYRYFEVYVSLAIIYWLVTLVIEQIIRVIENKIRIPDQVELASANGEGKKNDKN